jgi:hypothetical protein
MRCRHPLAQIVCNIADRVKVGVAGLGAGFKMRCLCNRPAPQDTYTQSRFFFDRHVITPFQSDVHFRKNDSS